jgi:hypothetical protein
MLLSLDEKIMPPVPVKRAKEYRRWCEILDSHTPGGCDAAKNFMREYATRHPQFIECSVMAGADWHGTPLQAIHDAVCNLGETKPRFFLGLLLWNALATDDSTWMFIDQGSTDDEEVMGKRYWKHEPTPKYPFRVSIS